MKHDRYERVNFERERQKIFKLYRGTPILERREILQDRIMQSLVCFYRKVLQDIRFSPCNPFTEWIEMNQQKTDFRITVLNVTLDDLKLIDEPFFSAYYIHDRAL